METFGSLGQPQGDTAVHKRKVDLGLKGPEVSVMLWSGVLLEPL